MNPLILAVVLIGGFLVAKGVSGGTSSASSGGAGGDSNSNVTRSNPWNLPDIDSANQGGSFATTYDESFEKAAGATGAPFALLKAHAIRESALSPTAFHEDNSSESSYGLMQVEWSMDTSNSLYNRLQKYGSQYSGDMLTPNTLEDPDTSAFLGASIIADNLNWLTPGGKNGLQGLRDTINAYNTGQSEAKAPAPNNYVNDVLQNYATLIGESVTC